MIVREALRILPRFITFLSDFIASAAFFKWEAQSGYFLSENNKYIRYSNSVERMFIKDVKQLFYWVEIPSVKSNVHSNVADPLTTLHFSSMFSPQTEIFCVDNMSRFKKQVLYVWN